jgi:hypothetical protein
MGKNGLPVLCQDCWILILLNPGYLHVLIPVFEIAAVDEVVPQSDPLKSAQAHRNK